MIAQETRPAQGPAHVRAELVYDFEVLDLGNDVRILAQVVDSDPGEVKIGAPVMLVALIVGLGISLFQALTQIQEMTLAFVPKILIIFVSVLVLLPFMLASLDSFMEQIVDKIVSLG